MRQYALTFGNSYARVGVASLKGPPRVLRPESEPGFATEFWFDGGTAAFGLEALEKRRQNEAHFISGLSDWIEEVDRSERRLLYQGRERSLVEILALLVRRGVWDGLAMVLLREGFIDVLREGITAVLVVPSRYTPKGIELLTRALQIAGVRVGNTVPEHVAMLHGYGMREWPEGKTLCVDLGRHLKLQLVERVGNEAHVIADSKVAGLGGPSFANAFRNWLLRRFSAQRKRGFDHWFPNQKLAFDVALRDLITSVGDSSRSEYTFAFENEELHFTREDDGIDRSGDDLELTPSVQTLFTSALSALHARIEHFIMDHTPLGRPRLRVQQLLLAGGGFCFPFIATEVQKSVRAERGVPPCDVGFDGITAIGGALFGLERGIDEGLVQAIEHEEVRSFVRSVRHDDAALLGDPLSRSNVKQPLPMENCSFADETLHLGIRVFGQSPVVRLAARIDVAGKLLATVERENEASDIQRWAEFLEDGSLHIVLGKPNDRTIVLVVSTDAPLWKVGFSLDIRDVVTSQVLVTLSADGGAIPKDILSVDVAEIYHKGTGWKIRNILPPKADVVVEAPRPAVVPPPALAQPPSVTPAAKRPIKTHDPSDRVKVGDRVVAPEADFSIKAFPTDAVAMSVAAYATPDDLLPSEVVTVSKAHPQSAIQALPEAVLEFHEAARQYPKLVVSGLVARPLRAGELLLEVADAAGLRYWYRNDESELLPGRMTVLEVYVHKGTWKFRIRMSTSGDQTKIDDILRGEYRKVDYRASAVPAFVMGGRYVMEPELGGRLRVDFICRAAASVGLRVVGRSNGAVVDWRPESALGRSGDEVLSVLLDTTSIEIGSLDFVVAGLQDSLESVVFRDPHTDRPLGSYAIASTRKYPDPCALVHVYQHQGKWKYRLDDEAHTRE